MRCCELYGDWPVLIPAAGDDLHELLTRAALPQHVVWLDDLERYLVLGRPVDVAMLNALAESGCRVVATIRSSEWDKFRPVEDVKPPAWEALQRFTRIDLPDEQDEQDRLADRVQDPHTAAGIRRYGIGEYIGGGYLALDRYTTGTATHPLAIAMLHAAADWRRLGFAAIPEATLLQLAPSYLTDKQQRTNRDTTETALDWAGQDIAGLHLLETTPAGWRIFGFLLDHITTHRPTIPDATWQAAGDAATDQPTVAFTLGYRAYQAGKPAVAATAWQSAIDSDQPDYAPKMEHTTQMKLVQSVPLQAMQLTPDTVRAVSEWVAGPGASGYSWYEGSPARFRTMAGELTVPMGGWVVRIGSQYLAFGDEEFSSIFPD